jgi:hypothetical protein
MKAQMLRFRICPICRHKGPSYLSFLCLARQENLAHQLDNELQPCERHMCVFVCVCVWIHTLCCTLLWYLDNSSAVGVMAHNTLGSLTSLVFPQGNSQWGYLSRGWEGIGGKQLWLSLPEVHEPRHGGERDCCPRLSPQPVTPYVLFDTFWQCYPLFFFFMTTNKKQQCPYVFFHDEQ